MKKIILKTLIGLAVFMSASSAAFAELYCENTPEENVFYVGDKGFILLDEGEKDGEKAYLILSKDFYDSRYYGGLADDADSAGSWEAFDHYFDVEGTYDPYNVGYWLNNEFIERVDGTGLPVSGEKKMADYIPETVWSTEACSPGSVCPVTEYAPSVTKHYDVTAKIVLPSCEELNEYADKIGYRDGADTYWWTRSRYYAYNDINIVSVVNSQNGVIGYRNGGKHPTRPMFWLYEDFFVNIPVDADTIGENVRQIIKNSFTEEELLALYPQSDVDKLLLEGEYNEPASVIQESCAYVYGSLDTTYKNREISVLALKPGADSGAPSDTDIIYIGQAAVDENGEYELYFNTKNSAFDLYISDGGEMKKQIPYKDFTGKHYIRTEISDAEYIGEYIYSLTAELKNVFSDSEAVCDIYFAMYDEAGRLCGVEKHSFDVSEDSQLRTEELSFTLKSGVSSVIAYAWSETTPLTDDKTLVQVDLNTLEKLTSATNKTGNIYTDNEQISFVINGEEGKTVRYTLYDFWDNIAATGTFVLENENYSWILPYNGLGYFRLDFKYEYYDIDNTISQYLCIVTDENFDDAEGSPFGVNAHFEWTQYGFDPELVHYMALMGARSVRTGYSWGGVEQEKGVYKINEAGLSQMREHNMRMNLVTGYGNSLYEGQMWFPWNDEGRKAFSDYQLGVMEYVDDLVDEVDVWNEWYGGGDSNNWYYYSLLKECYAPFKEKYPDVEILGNSATDSAHRGWYNKLLGFGAQDYMDGIYPHIYYHDSEPEPAILEAKEFYDNIHAQYNISDMKMYLTETGATTAAGTGVSEEEQASRLVRAYAIVLYCGFEKIYWYDFVNDGETLTEREHNFGLVRGAYSSKGRFTPKPAYVAYAVMARQLTGYECTGMRMLGDNSDIYCVSFANGDDVVNVVWSLTEQSYLLEGEHSVTDIMGVSENKTELLLNRYPVYVKGII